MTLQLNHQQLLADTARIGLMFLDADAFENVLIDKVGHVDYHFENFNTVKKAVMKIERMRPELELTVIVWQRRYDNPEVALPLVAGKSLPVEGYSHAHINDGMRAAFAGGTGSFERDKSISHYFPVRNSDADIVGVLELLENRVAGNDI